MAMTFFGLYLYNQSKGDVAKGERKRTVIEKRAQILLPTTASEARLMDSTNTNSLEITPSVTPLPYGANQAGLSPRSNNLALRAVSPPAPKFRTAEIPAWTSTERNSDGRRESDNVRMRNQSVSHAGSLTPSSTHQISVG